MVTYVIAPSVNSHSFLPNAPSQIFEPSNLLERKYEYQICVKSWVLGVGKK